MVVRVAGVATHLGECGGGCGDVLRSKLIRDGHGGHVKGRVTFEVGLDDGGRLDKDLLVRLREELGRDAACAACIGLEDKGYHGGCDRGGLPDGQREAVHTEA